MKKLQVCSYHIRGDSIQWFVVLPANSFIEAKEELGKRIPGAILTNTEHITLPIGTSIAVKNDGGVYVTIKETEK